MSDVAAPSSPYVGLRPFREEEFELFFGRERETRIIASNLQARSLTVLHGLSGVGKSSVLQAGVVQLLNRQPDTKAYYFRDWQSETLLRDILRDIGRFLPQDGLSEKGDPEGSPAQRAFLLFDQFEEFLLYHGNAKLGEDFDSTLARIVNRKDCPVNVLIGIRSDSLYQLDRRLSLRIPNLLRDTLEVQRMAPAGARKAIQEPLVVFSKRYGNGNTYTIDPKLVDAICEQVQAGAVISDSTGVGTHSRTKDSRIETAYLQLVLTELWEEEQRRWKREQGLSRQSGTNEYTLRLGTLTDLGGAAKIVKNHVNSVMNSLATNRERDIAADMFLHLVTPSRSKIAQTTRDLVSYTRKPEKEVKTVLERLTDSSESRILRRISDPEQEQYEIFHDVLAQPLLDWRRTHTEAKARQRFWLYLAGAGAISLVLAALSIYALKERRIALDERAQAQKAYSLANDTELRLASLNQRSQDIQITLDAVKAKGGNEEEIATLKSQLEQNAQQALLINVNYQKQQRTLNESLMRASRASQDLVTAQGQVQTLTEQLATANAKIEDLNRQILGLQMRISEFQAEKTPVKASTPEQPGKPVSPTGLTATVNGGSARGGRTLQAPQTMDPGTEICGTLLQKKISSGNKPLTDVLLYSIKLPYGGKGWLDGVFEKPADSSSAKGAITLRFGRLGYYPLSNSPAVGFWATQITTTLKSVTLARSGRQLDVDADGTITEHQPWSIPSQSTVCVTLTQAVVLNFTEAGANFHPAFNQR